MCSNPRNTMCSHSLLDKKPSPSFAKSSNSWHNSTQKSTAAPFLRHLFSLSFSAPARRRLVSAEMCRVSQFFKEFGTNLTLNPAPPLLTSYRKIIWEKIGQNLIFPTIYLTHWHPEISGKKTHFWTFLTFLAWMWATLAPLYLKGIYNKTTFFSFHWISTSSTSPLLWRFSHLLPVGKYIMIIIKLVACHLTRVWKK